MTTKLSTSAIAKARVKTREVEESAEAEVEVAVRPPGKLMSFMTSKFRPSTTIQGMTDLNPHDELPTLKKSDQNLGCSWMSRF